MARIVMKFGGTSMAGTERIRRVANLVRKQQAAGHEVAVVVSAMAGATFPLLRAARLAPADAMRPDIPWRTAAWRGLVMIMTAVGIQLDPDQQAAIISAGLAVAGILAVFFKRNPDSLLKA